MITQQLKRYKKIFEDPLYLIDYNMENEILMFHVSGSTKNIYTVKIRINIVDCDCPDNRSWAKKYKVCCKHVCYVLFKVVKVFIETSGTIATINNDPTNFFSQLKPSLEEYKYMKMFIENKKISSDVISQELIEKYNRLKLNPTESVDKFKKSTRELNAEDDCPICYDVLGSNTNDLLSCPDCNNYVHIKCMEKWLEYNKSCVYCRSEVWEDLGKKQNKEKYLNLA